MKSAIFRAVQTTDIPMQLQTYLLFDNPLLISSPCYLLSPLLFPLLPFPGSSSQSSFFLFSYIFWYIHLLLLCKASKHSAKHYLDHNKTITYLFLSDATYLMQDCLIFIELPLHVSHLPHLETDKESTEYDLKT